jgi:regulator of replication initiation timing
MTKDDFRQPRINHLKARMTETLSKAKQLRQNMESLVDDVKQINLEIEADLAQRKAQKQ